MPLFLCWFSQRLIPIFGLRIWIDVFRRSSSILHLADTPPSNQSGQLLVGEIFGVISLALLIMLELFTLGLLILAIAMLFNLWPQPQPANRQHKPSPAFSGWGSTSSQQLHNKLIRLLRGDRKAAHRLLEHVRQMHPGRSERWYYEKVIYDLQRDRRS